MKRIWGAARRPLRWARRLLLALLSPLLLLAALGQWWLLPNLNHYRDDLADALSDALHTSARIEAVTAEREGWRLGLRLRGVSLRDPKTGIMLASFNRAAVALNLWRSVREWRPIFDHIRLEGVNLTLEQNQGETPRLRADADDTQAIAPTLAEVTRWLFAINRLDIIGDQLTLRRQDGVTLRILHPYFQVRDTERGQQLGFSADLPAEWGGGRLQLTLEQPRIDLEFQQGAFELHADRLRLTGWPLLTRQASLSSVSSEEPAKREDIWATLELHGDWRDGQPTSVTGRLQLSKALLNPPEHQRSLHSSKSEKKAIRSEWIWDGQQQETGWRLQGHARFDDSEGRILSQPTFEASQTSEQWHGQIRDLRIQDIAAWATLWLDSSSGAWLASLDPQGNIPEATFQIDPAAADYTMTVQVRDIALQATHGLPGLHHLSGAVELTPRQGQIHLDSQKVRVNAPDVLRAPITLDTVAGTVSWAQKADGLHLESTGLELANADFNARLEGNATLLDAGPWALDLRGAFREVVIGRVRHYLPTLIPANGLAWLDRALVGGQAAGNLTLRGLTTDFPFDKGQGLFETRLQVKNATLNYAPGWPRLEKLQAAVTFRNRGLRVEADSGSLLDTKAERIVAWIDDLNQTTVRVQGRVRGPGATFWQALKDSPVGQRLSGDLPDLRIKGINTLDLDLTLPVSENTHAAYQVKGQVGLLGGSVVLPDWNLEFSRMRGEASFTENNLNAANVQTLLRGEPTRLNLELVDRKDHRALRARLQGRWNVQTLMGERATVVERYTNGKSRWEAMLTVPTGRRKQSDETPSFTLDLNSDLRGIAVLLPAPLGKTAGETRSLHVSVQPRERATLEVMLEYGEGVRAALQLDASRDPQLARGEVRINAGAAKLPDVPGLAVIARLPRWQWMMPTRISSRPLPEKNAPEQTPSGLWRILHSLDLRVGEWRIGGQTFSAVSLSALRQDAGLRIEINSDALAGRIIAPDQPSPERPIRATMRRLSLHQSTDFISSAAQDTDVDADAFDPRQFPALLLTVADLRLNDTALGRLKLVAMPHLDGLRLAEFQLNSEQQRIDAAGDWQWTPDGPTSRLQATVHSQALGETLAALGYSGAGIARGETEADMDVAWAAGPLDFTPDRLEGTLKFQVGPGQLLDVDPGVGRVVGVFNVQNLMRRLSLDFSDLFQSGMGFDRITGEFRFKEGQAYTDNLTIEAPAAHIQIQGRVGLKERDYEQRITVTPRVGGALPVAGALAGGPAVGAAVLLAERLLQKGIEQATRYHYALTGSWDRPVIKLLEGSQFTAQPKGLTGDR